MAMKMTANKSIQENKNNHNYKKSEEVVTSSVSGIDIAVGHYEYTNQYGSRVYEFYAREIYKFY